MHRCRVAVASIVLSVLAPGLAQAQPRHRNPPMRVAGIVLTSVAAATLVAGIGVMALDLSSNTGDVHGLVAVLVGAPMVGGSALIAAAGVPLWVIGSKPPAHHGAELPTWLPAVAPSRSGAGLRWTF